MTDALQNGLFPVPAGKVAVVVTSLEMTTRPALAELPLPDGISLRHVAAPDLSWYRDLQRRVGEPWLWYLRASLDDDALAAIVHDRDVAVHALMVGERAEGIVELDFRVPGEVELAYFGLTPAMVGRGLGRALMATTLRIAWERSPRRVWVHTCTADHPSALGFYIRSGFRPFARQVEIDDDPRVLGVLPRAVAQHVPIIE